ncbi:MAG TPA: CHAD domain-containing protein [Anaerolineae bacterium]|jgi:CHAD domain-containing protein
MDTDHREIEWQFDADDIHVVADWLTAYPQDSAVNVGHPSSTMQVDTYLDTPDWRIYRAGYGLRVRRKGTAAPPVATMKSIEEASVEGLRQRREINETLAVGDASENIALLLSAQGEVGARVRRVRGNSELRELFETRTQRTVFALQVGSQRIGEVDLDDTVVKGATPDRDIHMQRVEVEIESGAEQTRAVNAFVRQMVKMCGLRSAEMSKFEAGLKARDLKPLQIQASDFGATGVKATTIGGMAWDVVRNNFAAILSYECGARLGDDSEQIHQMRVSIRRMRAAFRIFGDVLPQRIAKQATELSWVAKELGAVRDLDVMIERTIAWSLESADTTAFQTVAAWLIAERSEEFQRLLETLNSERYAKFTTDFARLLRKPFPGPAWAQAPALKAIPALIRQRYRKVRKLGDTLKPTSPATDFHRLRIKSKRLRYGLEFIEPLYGKPAKRALTEASIMQDTLGYFQDAQVAIHRLRALSTSEHNRPSEATLAAFATVIHRYGQATANLLNDFPLAYAHLHGKPWKRLWKKMKAAIP